MSNDKTGSAVGNTAGLFDSALDHYRNRRPVEAESVCRELLTVQPGHAQARHLLGVLLLQRGQVQDAVDMLRMAVADAPGNARFLYNLGLACHAQVLNTKAMEIFRRVLELQPAFPEALVSLGILCEREGRTDEALDCYRRASALHPDDPRTVGLLAGLYQRLGMPERALACYREIVRLLPGNADVLNGMGVVYYSVGDLGNAVSCYRQALNAEPGAVAVLNNLGAALQGMGRTEEAAESYRQALAVHPGNSLWELRIVSLCPVVAGSVEEIDGYRSGLAASLERMSETRLSATPDEIVEAGIYPSYSLMYHGCDDRPLREAYVRLLVPCFPDMPEPRLTGRRRIGFVVTRLHEGIFLRSLRGVLQHMDPAAFELVVICQQEGEAKLRSSFDCSHVQVLVMPDRINAVVELLSRECFDILYYWEVGTDAMNYCLPFYRLAPIQCTSWGVQVTTGIPNMDYYLSSGLVEPDGADAKYTETLVCADTLLTYQYRMTLPDKVKRREDFGFSGSHHLYLFPQQIGKFHPDFDAVAKDILRRDPQGRLVILKDRWEYSAARLTERLKRSAGDVMDRVVFLPRLDHADYLGLVAAADVLLDPPCYGGVNSSYDGFSLGKPIVTVETDFHIGRYTAGCYRKMGLADCLASSPGDYADIAVRLGTDRDWREEVGERIVSASAALFEDMRAVREHERIFSELLDTL